MGSSCGGNLTEADVPGWHQKYSNPLQASFAGLLGGTMVSFETAIGDSVGNIVACFDTSANAMAAFEQWDTSCITGNSQNVPITDTVGDAVKVVFCPAGTFNGSDVKQQLALVAVVGSNLFTIAANGETYPPSDASVDVLVRLANAVLAHLTG